jgi:hydroxyethylthiazole kinase-like uncharacterized protein yjeF
VRRTLQVRDATLDRMTSLPTNVHTAAQVRALDRHAIEHDGIPSYELMTRAARSALALLRASWPAARRIVIVCGSGNNGGDGYVLARLARTAQLEVDVIALTPAANLSGDASRACQEFATHGGEPRSWNDACLDDADVIVDAVFGVGLSRAVQGAEAVAIDAMNHAGVPILALDIPSGLHADTGHVLGVAVRATRTIAFVGLKLGFYLGDGPDHTGVMAFDDLQIPAKSGIGTAATRLGIDVLRHALPRRARTAHKGDHGHVLVIGGNRGMAGAARLAGEAALRVGAGLVTVVTRSENVAAVMMGRPELMCRGVERPEDVLPLIERADVIAIGPGLGQDVWAKALWPLALDAGKPAIVDADALNLLAQTPRTSNDWVLTPHPGEAARLLGVTTPLVQADRLESARALANRYGGHIVLKGAGTLVVTKDALPAICDRGNPGMAAPGMGDVLTGVIAGIAAQTRDLALAARAGVLAHAMAGDLAARRGERGLLASDLFDHLSTCVNPIQLS